MRIRGLCIGGYGDGRWIESDAPHLRVPEPIPRSPASAWKAASEYAPQEPVSIKIDDYVAEPFEMQFPDGYRRRWYLWRLSSMSASDCVQMLFDGYRRP